MDAFIQSVVDFLGRIAGIPNNELKLALFGAVGIVVLFLLALLFTLGSKVRGLVKKLIFSTKNIAAGGMINEENVEGIHAEIAKLPEGAMRGWSCFLDQRLGYPSDYMPERDVLSERIYSGKNTAGKIFYGLLGLFVVLFTAFLAAFVCSADFASVGIKDFTDNFSLVASILATVFIPLFCYVVGYLILRQIYHKQTDRLKMSYQSFQDVLDDNVMIYASEDEVFASENLDTINASIDEIIRSSTGDGHIEILTAPRIEETEYIEIEEIEDTAEETTEEVVTVVEEFIEEPAEETEDTAEAMEEEVAAAVPMSKEEEERYLAILRVIVDQALADPDCKDSDLEEIAVLIATAKEEGFEDPSDQEILDECLYKLAARYFDD